MSTSNDKSIYRLSAVLCSLLFLLVMGLGAIGTSLNDNLPTAVARGSAGAPLRTDTDTPTPTATAVSEICSNYTFSVDRDTLVPGTDFVVGSNCDDCMVTLPLPFTYSFYGAGYTYVRADSNGNLQFTSNTSLWSNYCLPAANVNNIIMPFWYDLNASACAGCGIYTSTSGTAPNRIFNIEWRTATYDRGREVNFEVRLYEGQAAFDFLYGPLATGPVAGTVGVQQNVNNKLAYNADRYSCGTGGLIQGLKISFVQAACDTPTPIANCPVPIVDPTYFNVPYRGGGYWAYINVGSQCTWSVQRSDFLQFYCSSGSGVGPGWFSCGFPTNPGTNTRFGYISACTVGCAGVNVTWNGSAVTPPTNTPVPPPPSPTKTRLPADTLIGHISWQGIPQPNVRNISMSGTLTLCAAGSLYSSTAATDDDGWFTLGTGLPDGTYNWAFKGSKWLATSGTLVMSGTTIKEFGAQVAGDADDSNSVGSQDFIILRAAFGRQPGEPGYDPRADFNNDSLCNIADLNLLKGSFGQQGATRTCDEAHIP